MAKQLNVNMSFTADSSQAKKQLQELQMSLNKLMSSSRVDLGINDEIQSAVKSAAELSAHLQEATNVKTGNLDFAKLNQSIKASGKTLTQYGRSLQELGPTGQQAFMQLTRAIAQSEIPFRRTNALVKEFATTLANTARWQLSSSVLHGFMGALQSAYGYAQDLNESLNNIRIVTGASIDDMSRFAAEANKAAKALSTTTTAYTDASLIYFQQGLSEADVKKRADVTIKLANISRQSAADVSDQMTAIWNNFYDGSASLEHYADVLTALGAATASSTEEIAGGLEKFAAIAQTIGLSYDYAAAALATLTSNTRESEEVVGTALKTIFARIQGLNLGETLEDGTTLNKYSQALATVGINIKDTNGNLKDMDDILDAMGRKWDQLSRDQQTALAQTVAGTRQYNQLMALMANWNNGDNDSFQANLTTTKNANGALKEQADIYAESWEAAADRVKAAAEDIYNKLINDEFFIDLLNNIEKILEFISTIIDRVGGLRGVLLSLGTIVTKVFSQQISQGLSSMAYNIQMLTKAGRKKVEDEREAFLKSAARDMADSATDKGGGANSVAADIYTQQLTQQQVLLANAERMTEIEKHTVQMLMDQLKLRGELAIEKAKERDAAESTVEKSETKIYNAMKAKAQASHKKFDVDDLQKQLYTVKQSSTTTSVVSDILTQVKAEGQITKEQISAIKQAYLDLRATTEEGLYDSHDQKSLEGMLRYLESLTDNASAFNFELDKIQNKINDMDTAVQDGAKSALKDADPADIEAYASAVREQTKAEEELVEAQKNVTESSDSVTKAIKESSGAQKTWADHLVTTANVAMSAASAITMLGSVVNTLNDPDMSGWEKFTAILTTLSMLIPTLITLWTSLTTLLGTETLVKLGNVAATLAQYAAEKKLNKEKGISYNTTKKSIKETLQDTGKKLKETGKQGIEKIKGGWSKVKNFAGTKRDAVNKNIWDKLDGKTKSKYLSDYLKNNKDGVTRVTENGAYKYMRNGKNISKKEVAKLASKGASKTAGTKAVGSLVSKAGLIAAGVAVAVGAVAWGVSQFNKQAKAAEEAAIAADKAAEAYNHVAEAYNSFTANLDNYKNAKEGLKDLTEGTLEYREAVLKANEAAMELIDNNEGLQYEIDENGVIQINEESMKMVQEQKLEQMQKAQMSRQLAEQNARQKQLEADSTDFARESLHSGAGIKAGAENTLAATGAGVAAGALIGSAIPVIGTAIGAIVGGIAGLITGVIGSTTAGASSNSEQEALNKLAKVYEKEGNARFADETEFKKMLSEQGITDPLLIKSLTENRESTMKLVKEMAANSAAVNAMNEQMISSEFGDELSAVFDQFYSTADDKTAAAMQKQTTEAMAVQLEKRTAELYEDEYKDQFGGLRDKEIQRQYAEAMGWDVEKTENKSGNKATYYDKNGNVVAEDLSDEVARQFLAQQAALKELEESMPYYVAAVQNLANAGDALGKGIGTALASFAGGDGGNLNTLTSDQFTALQNVKPTVTKDSSGNVTSFTINGEVFDDEKAKLLGYENAKAFYEAYEAEIKRIDEAWEKINFDIDGDGIEDFKNVSDMSLETAQKFQESLDQMSYGALGADGPKKFAEGVDLIADSVVNMNGEVGMGEADMAAFIEQLGNVDWSNWYAMEDVESMLETLGYQLDLTNPKIKEFIEVMRQVGAASPVDMLERTEKNAALLSSELSKGIAPGSVLDEETYTAVIESNKELENQFMKMMDGSYKYVGDKTLNFGNTLDMSEVLAQTREMNQLYAKAKQAASDINFEGLSKMEFVTSSQIEEADKAINNAQALYDKAYEEHSSDGFFGIGIINSSEEADLIAKQSTINSAKQNKTNLETQRTKDFAQAKEAVQAVLNNAELKAVAEKEGWTKETLDAMLSGLQSGDDTAMQQMKKFADEMNKFIAAGNVGQYDLVEAEEKIASTATSIEELDALTEEYSLSTATYSKAITGLFTDAANEAKTLEELDELKQKVLDAGGAVNQTAYADNVKRITEENLSAADSFEELKQVWQAANETGVNLDSEVYIENIKRLAEESTGAANSLSELQQVWSQSLNFGEQLDYSLYADNLLRLADSYSICADEATAFQIALQSGGANAIKMAEENLEAALMLGEAAQKYGLEEKELSVQSKSLAQQHGLNAKAAAQLVIQNQRMNKGVAELVNNWDDWSSILKTSDKTSRDWASAAADCTAVIADLVGASEDLELPNEFFDSAKNLALMEQAAQGDKNAIEALGVAVAEAQIQMINFQQGMAGLDGQLITTSQFTTWKDTVLSGIQELQDALNNVGVGQNVYELLGGDDWVAALNDMAIATNMSVEQMNSILNSMGVQADVQVQDVPQKVKVPIYRTKHTNQEYDSNGNLIAYDSQTVQTGTAEMDGVIQVAQINTGDDIGTPPSITFTGNGTVSASAKSGNSSGGSTPPDKEGPEVDSNQYKQNDKEIERYYEISNALETVGRKLDEVGKKKDRAFGANKLKAIEEESELLEEQIGLQEQYLNQIENNLNSDKNKVAGYGFTFDENNNINNYDEIMTNRVNAYNSAYDAYIAAQQAAANTYNASNKDAAAEEAYNAALEAAEKQFEQAEDSYNTFIDDVTQYGETVDLFGESKLSLQDMQNQLQDLNFEKLNTKLELKLTIDENDLKIIDYKISKLGDSIYNAAEALQVMIGATGKGDANSQLNEYLNGLNTYTSYMSELESSYRSGAISESAYAEGLQKIQDGTLEQLQSLQELDTTMKEYYGNTVAKAGEEMSYYTNKMAHQNEVLDHYHNLMGIIGKEVDYESIAIILDGQAKMIENDLKVAKSQLDMYSEQMKYWKEKMDSVARDSEAYKLYEQNWRAAEEASTEAQNTIMKQTEAWAEKMKEILENKLSDMAQTLEKSLTGGTSFDQLTTSLERASSIQEDYLTTTNQIYETTKMMRTAQQAIDASSNTVAKDKLKNFITETKSMQEQGKLSKYELEMQQAKYNLLVAEIALEEAQNAKSTVRLQRDSEGNFGYVYTADAGMVNEAQQKFEDAQNALYNKGLDGANDYTQKYQQTMSEMTDTLKTIQEDYLNGSFASEAEYNAAMENAKAFYFEKLQGYSNLYSVALSADSNVAAEAWSTDFASMIKNTEEWKVRVDEYISGVTLAFSDWAQTISTIQNTTGKDLTELADNVNNITDENSELSEAILNEENGVVKALTDELNAVKDLTAAYNDYRSTVDLVIKSLERVAILSNNKLSGLSVGGTTVTTTTTSIPSDTATNDDGGYTGSWGPGGKLAFLHEKEMILTKDETEKFFNYLETMENILATLDLYTLQQQLRGSLINPDYYGNGLNAIEQNVKIEASFPSVTDRNEIEEAFNNLVNKASQYANRK